MKSLIIVLITSMAASCASTKSEKTEVHSAYDGDSLGGLTRSISEFVQTIKLDQLCYPSTLFVIFSVDETGKIVDADFKATTLTVENCRPDSNYINALKSEFEEQMPRWVASEKDSIVPARYTIPVRYR